METLNKKFLSREEFFTFVKELAPWAEGEMSPIQGGRNAAEKKLANIDPINYANTRSFGDGKVTQLSPYIHSNCAALSAVILGLTL